jgi:hypothetical protein
MNLQLTKEEKLDINISVYKDLKKFLVVDGIENQIKWLESYLIELKSQNKSEVNRLESIINDLRK